MGFTDDYLDRTAGLRNFVNPPALAPQPKKLEDQSALGKFLSFATEAFSPGTVSANEQAAAAPPPMPVAAPFRDSFLGNLAQTFIPGLRGQFDAQRGSALADLYQQQNIPGAAPIIAAMKADPRNAKEYASALMRLSLDNADPIHQAQVQEAQDKMKDRTATGNIFQQLQDQMQPPQDASAPSVATPAPTGSAPIGVQANNPLNIRTSAANNWRGQTGQIKGFAAFDTPQDGFRAGAKILNSYAKDGINTLDGVIQKWAPKEDGNDPESYANQVSQLTGISRSANIDPSDPFLQKNLLAAMQQVEIGPNNAKDAATVSSGVDLAHNVAPAKQSALAQLVANNPQAALAIQLAAKDPEKYGGMALAALTKADKSESTPYTTQGKAAADYAHGFITKEQLAAQTPAAGLADSGLQGPEAMQYLQQNDKGLASDVQMALRGDYPMTSMSSRNQHTLDVMRAANLVDPSFTPSAYPARVATAKDFSPAGKSGQTLVAINTSASHLADLKKAYQDLDNSGFTSWNWLANKAAGQFDTKTHAALNRFQTALNAVAPELAKIYSGTGTVAEGEIKHRRDAFNPNDGPEAMKAALQEAASLIKGKSDSLIAAYQQTMGSKKPPTFQPFTDKALAEFADLGVDLSPANMAAQQPQEGGAPTLKTPGGISYSVVGP